MIFHMNRVAYFKTLHHTLKITWCVISLLAHHISKQRNEPLSADKSCQNRPIIGYTSVWSTGTSFCLSLTGVPSLLHPLLFSSAYISLHWPHDLNAWNRVPWVWQCGRQPFYFRFQSRQQFSGFHLTSPIFPFMGICRIGAPLEWNSCKAKAIFTPSFSFKHMFWSLKWISVMRLGKKNIPVFSEYAKDLEGQVKEWYV